MVKIGSKKSQNVNQINKFVKFIPKIIDFNSTAKNIWKIKWEIVCQIKCAERIILTERICEYNAKWRKWFYIQVVDGKFNGVLNAYCVVDAIFCGVLGANLNTSKYWLWLKLNENIPQHN